MISVLIAFAEILLMPIMMVYFILYTRAKVNLQAALHAGLESSVETWKKKKDTYSKIWHSIGLIMRTGFVLIPVVEYWKDWYNLILYTLIAIILSWTVFDRILNLGLKKSFFYVDSHRFNKMLGKAYWIITIALILFLIYWIIRGFFI